MTRFDVKLNATERSLIDELLGRADPAPGKRRVEMSWKELKRFGFWFFQNKEQLRKYTNKLMEQQVAYLEERRKNKDVVVIALPIICKCSIVEEKSGGFTIAFDINKDVLERKIRTYESVKAHNNLSERFLALTA